MASRIAAVPLGSEVDPCCCEVECPGEVALDGVASGIDEACPACFNGIGNVSVVDSNANGAFAFTSTGPLAWAATSAGAVSYRKYAASDCTGGFTSHTADLLWEATCLDGVMTVTGYFQTSDENVAIFEGSGTFGSAIANTLDCGGSITLTVA